MKRIKHIMLLVSLFATALYASAQTDYEKTKQEITLALGTVPSFLEAVPEPMLASSWQQFTNYAHPDNVIPMKYMELAKIAVAAQIPCQYCVYAHTVNAKAAGATEQEIQEVVMHSAWVRHWSTVVNGAGIDFEDFKKEYDGIMEYLAKQAQK